MEAPSAELTPAQRSEEPINLLTGVFLKSVHFLDTDLTKCVISGIFKNRDNGLGLLFKGRKGCIYWSYDTFSQLVDRFNEVTLALEGKTKLLVLSDSGQSIKVNSVFGQQYVYLFDGKHSLALNTSEWRQLVSNIPLIGRSLLEIFYIEELIQVFINQVLTGTEIPANQLPSHVADLLYSEVSLYKLWANGGGS